jgi:hypothetical protein
MTLPWRGARELHSTASNLLTQFTKPAFENGAPWFRTPDSSPSDTLPASCRRYSGVRYVP